MNLAERKQRHMRNLFVINNKCKTFPFENDWYYRTQRRYLKRKRFIHLLGFAASIFLVALCCLAFYANAEENKLAEILDKHFVEQQARQAGVSEQEIARARLYGEILKQANESSETDRKTDADAALFQIIQEMIDNNRGR